MLAGGVGAGDRGQVGEGEDTEEYFKKFPFESGMARAQ
jgi:hypothetical protein